MSSNSSGCFSFSIQYNLWGRLWRRPRIGMFPRFFISFTEKETHKETIALWCVLTWCIAVCGIKFKVQLSSISGRLITYKMDGAVKRLSRYCCCCWILQKPQRDTFWFSLCALAFKGLYTPSWVRFDGKSDWNWAWTAKLFLCFFCVFTAKWISNPMLYCTRSKYFYFRCSFPCVDHTPALS